MESNGLYNNKSKSCTGYEWNIIKLKFYRRIEGVGSIFNSETYLTANDQLFHQLYFFFLKIKNGYEYKSKNFNDFLSFFF